MMTVTVCVLLFTMFTGTYAGPCDHYSVLDDSWRSVTYITGSDRHCDAPGYDASTGLTEGWYRFTGPAGTQMPTAAPGSTYLCGTFAPVWLNGVHPAAADGVVTRQVCAYRDENYHCAWRWDIQVAACPGGFYLYHLISPPTCNLGYCVENGAGPTVVTTTMIPTTAITDVSSPPVYNSLCYKLSQDVTRDYESSAQECAALGGSLALIGDAATQSFVADLIRGHSNVSHWAGSTSPAVHCSYSGPSAAIDHDLWTSGHPPMFCVYMDSGANYKFNVAVCSEEYGFVCQSDIVTCQHDVCQNGGTCTSCFGAAHVMCTCLPGFTGTRCETRLYL
ncbi:UMOD [Branchiostoma lanceolatum]|uniref:UMOD protein n=1 Tax=Branchiostoma lanceolatum TaxID=7740 RepID=A0A8J9VGQ0_BRALA|nr:UMOD [Branchiostoma lanceolatum]